MSDIEDRTRIVAIVAAKLVGGDLANPSDTEGCRYFNNDGDLLEKDAVADACLLLSEARKAVLADGDL